MRTNLFDERIILSWFQCCSHLKYISFKKEGKHRLQVIPNKSNVTLIIHTNLNISIHYPAIPEHLQFFSRQANTSNFFKSIRNSASYGLLRQFRSFVSRNKWNLMGVNWEGLGEGVIAFLKKELDCKSECSKWGTFLTPNKKRVTLSTTLTTLTLIVFNEGQNSFHRSFHIMKIGKNHQFCCRIIWAEGCSQTGGGGRGEGVGWWLRCMWLPFLPFLHTKK